MRTQAGTSQAEVGLKRERGDNHVSPEPPGWASASTVSPWEAVHDPIPQLTFDVQLFHEFPDIPGEAAAINQKCMLQLLPLLVAECAPRPRLQEADGVRLIAPSIGLQLPQPREAVCACPAAVGERGDLEALEEKGVCGAGENTDRRSRGNGRESTEGRRKEKRKKETVRFGKKG